MPSLIAQHSSWISIDPVQGCPASCAYCYLEPIHLTQKRPTIIEKDPSIIYSNLLSYRYFDKSIFQGMQFSNPPIAIGNYTDICMTPEGREVLLALLHKHSHVLPTTPVCIPTKAALSEKFLERINEINVRVIFFISLSFLPNEFERGTASIENRLSNFKLISKFPKLKAVHWWRPITSLSVPNKDAINYQLDLLQASESTISVVIGLMYGQKLAEAFEKSTSPLQKYFLSHREKSKYLIFENWIGEEILKIAKIKSYNIFTSTSCAISYLLESQCYTARFRKPHFSTSCLASTCSDVQKERCQAFKQKLQSPSNKLLKRIALYLDLPTERVIFEESLESILIDGTITQEMQNFLIQATMFPVKTKSLIQNLEWAESWRTISP